MMFKFLTPFFSPNCLTFRFFWPFIILLLLIWFPITGIFLMFMLGLPYFIAGVLPHVMAITYVIDVLLLKLPRALILLAVIPYILYYGFYFTEQIRLSGLEQEMRQNNRFDLISYDPEIHSLIMPNTRVTTHKIPVSYSPNTSYPEGYRSHRLLTKDACDQIKGTDENIVITFVSRREEGSTYKRKSLGNICQIMIPEVPKKQKLEIVIDEPNDRKDPLQKTIHQVFLEDQKLGEFTTATYRYLPPFPVLIFGCFLNSGAASWDCQNGIYRFQKEFDVLPEEINTYKYGDWVMAPVLNIEAYAQDELENFQNYPDSLQFAVDLFKRKANETPADFDEWGLRKDSLYRGEIGEVNGYPSYKGKIYSGKKGGPFRDFIEAHEGQIVYLDIIAYVNANKRGFRNYGVCNDNLKDCSTGNDDAYHFKQENGKHYQAEERGVFKGFFRVGPREPVENKRRPDDHDTRTILTEVVP